MALYDSPDLLARTKRLAKRPTSDEDITDAQFYIYLQEAQTHWMAQLASLVPESNYGAPELLTTADNGYTYTLTSEPIGGHLELKASLTGTPLLPSTDWGSGDFVMEGQTIRIPGGRTRTFTAGPYARYVKSPGLLDGSNPPVLKPAWCRLLLPPRACYLFALEGGVRDPNPYRALEQKLWAGDPDFAGDGGFLQALKTQYFGAGTQAVAGQSGYWWQNPDMG